MRSFGVIESVQSIAIDYTEKSFEHMYKVTVRTWASTVLDYSRLMINKAMNYRYLWYTNYINNTNIY